MVYSASTQRRSTTKRRGSKRLTIEAPERGGPRREPDDRLLGWDDPRREDPASARPPYRLLRDAGGSG
jgi:hypothetical protein